jgi:hypothetical protein
MLVLRQTLRKMINSVPTLQQTGVLGRMIPYHLFLLNSGVDSMSVMVRNAQREGLILGWCLTCMRMELPFYNMQMIPFSY